MVRDSKGSGMNNTGPNGNPKEKKNRSLHGHNTLLTQYQNARAGKKYPNLEKLKPEFPDQAKKKIAPSKFASTVYIFS